MPRVSNVKPQDAYMQDNDGAYLASAEVSRKTGVSNRQLQWWDEQNILKPVVIVGHRRFYRVSDIETVKRIRILSKAGVQPRLAKRYLKLDWKEVRSITGPTVIDGVLIVPRSK